MSSSEEQTPLAEAERLRRNDSYAWIDGYAEDLHKAAKDLVSKGEASRVSDEALAQILTAAVRLYYAKAEGEGRSPPAIVQEGPIETLTPTEMLTAVSELLRAVRLGPMELGLWFRRRPGD
ncbi:unnamed protein product [Phaeothamnion confervicola]